MMGFICLWSGSIANIPAGWHLCDGTMGTPDLRDKFIIGAGSTYGVGDTGGESSHNHTFTGDAHNHSLPAGMVLDNIAPAGDTDGSTTDAVATGTVESKATLPPYYALALIMKI